MSRTTYRSVSFPEGVSSAEVTSLQPNAVDYIQTGDASGLPPYAILREMFEEDVNLTEVGESMDNYDNISTSVNNYGLDSSNTITDAITGEPSATDSFLQKTNKLGVFQGEAREKLYNDLNSARTDKELLDSYEQIGATSQNTANAVRSIFDKTINAPFNALGFVAGQTQVEADRNTKLIANLALEEKLREKTRDRLAEDRQFASTDSQFLTNLAHSVNELNSTERRALLSADTSRINNILDERNRLAIAKQNNDFRQYKENSRAKESQIKAEAEARVLASEKLAEARERVKNKEGTPIGRTNDNSGVIEIINMDKNKNIIPSSSTTPTNFSVK